MKGSTITSHTQNSGNGGDDAIDSEASRAAHFSNIIDDNEVVCGTLTDPAGITRIKAGDRLVVDRTVITVVTDSRILFTTPEDGGEGAVTLAYDKVTSISVRDGEILELTTADDIGLEWPLSAESSATGGFVSHLTWVGDIRSRIRSIQNDVDLAAGEIRACAETLDWEEAESAYGEVRERLDDLSNQIYATEPIDAVVLAPELTEIERTLEEAYTRLYIERAESQLELGRQLVENGDYVQGRNVLQQAQEYYGRAQAKSDAIQRGDAFQFGAQREVQEDLESLGWKIETVAAEPIKQAHEAKIAAQSSTEAIEKLTHWERAFNRYGHVLTLEWGSGDRNFAGDPYKVRTEIERAADNLIELHGAVGNDRWNEGAELQTDGESKAALQACLDAQEHLERAHELATEFDPSRAEEIGSRLEKMADAVMRMRNAEGASTSETQETTDATETADTGESQSESTQSDESPGLPTASELAEMDTHHELTLTVDELEVSETNELDDESEPLETASREELGEDAETEVETLTNGDRRNGEPRQQ